MRRAAVRTFTLSPLLLAAFLAACSSTSSSQVCKSGVCTITLSGDGASVKVGAGDGNTLELLGTDGTTARVKVDANEGTLRTGVPVGFGDNHTIELKSVKGDEITVTVDTTTGPEDEVESRESGSAGPRGVLGKSGQRGG
jgi:hypothetical protein